MTGDISV